MPIKICVFSFTLIDFLLKKIVNDLTDTDLLVLLRFAAQTES